MSKTNQYSNKKMRGNLEKQDTSADSARNVKPRQSLNVNIWVLRILGIWFPEEAVSTWRTKLYFLFAILMQGFLFYLYTVSELINIFKSVGDIERMTAASFLLLTHMAQNAKNYYFYSQSRKIVDFLNALEQDIFKPRNDKQRTILKWAMSRAYWDSFILLSMALATCTLWAIFPFIETTEGHIRLPLSAWYPFLTDVTPNFEIVFVYQIVATTANAYTNISMDTTMTGILVHICGQIDMLRDSLQNMRATAKMNIYKKRNMLAPGGDVIITPKEADGKDSDWNFTDTELEEEMTLIYAGCVKHHEAIIAYVEEFEEIFSLSFLCQFTASVVIICLTLFQLSLVPSVFSVQFVSLVLYQGCIVFELLLYCWHGNEMILKSDEVAYSAYMSEWYECTPRFSKSIVLIMARSRRPIKATAGKFFALSLSTFTAILKSSWSYFAVLNNMHNEEEN